MRTMSSQTLTLKVENCFIPHHDMATIIRHVGGNANFIDRLHSNQTGTRMALPSLATLSSIHLTKSASRYRAYDTSLAGQNRSVKPSRYIAKTHYKPGRSGLAGNSDKGAMQTWLLWNMVGLYPSISQKTFLIGSPWSGISIDLGDEKTLKISMECKGDYVRSFKVNE